MLKDEISSFTTHVGGCWQDSVGSKQAKGWKMFDHKPHRVAESNLWVVPLGSIFHHIQTGKKNPYSRAAGSKTVPQLGGLILQNRAHLWYHSAQLQLPEPDKVEGWKTLVPCDYSGSLLIASILKEGQETLFMWMKVAEWKHHIDWWVAFIAAFGDPSSLCSAVWLSLILSLGADTPSQGKSPATVDNQGLEASWMRRLRHVWYV